MTWLSNNLWQRGNATAVLLAGMVLMLHAGASMSATTKVKPPNLDGIWMTPFKVNEFGPPIIGGSTPWLNKSAGDVTKLHIPTVEERDAMLTAAFKKNPASAAMGGPPQPPPPFTAAGKAAAVAPILKIYEDKELNCEPFNLFTGAQNGRIGGGLGPMEILTKPDRIVMLFEGGPHRTIYIDGRNHDDAIPAWNGHSIGHWDGNVLKVETTMIKGDFWSRTLPMSSDAILNEEYSLSKDGKTLTILATFTDQTFYTEPYQRLFKMYYSPKTELVEFDCNEGKSDQAEAVFKSLK